MSRLVEGIRDEIRRQSRREIKAALEPLNKKMSALRKSQSALNKQIAALEKHIARIERKAGKVATVGAPATAPQAMEATTPRSDGRSGSRLSAGLIKKLRKRLGISQGELALLVEVSQPAVASWEQDRAKPREGARARVIALRDLSKNEVQERLAAFQKSA